MSALFRVTLLALICAAVAPGLRAEERVIVVHCEVGEDAHIAGINALLLQGWTVKLVTSCSAAAYCYGGNVVQAAYFIFVLYRPDPVKAEARP